MDLEWVSSPSVKRMYRLLITFYWLQLNEIFYTASSYQYLLMFLDLFRNSEYFFKKFVFLFFCNYFVMFLSITVRFN